MTMVVIFHYRLMEEPHDIVNRIIEYCWLPVFSKDLCNSDVFRHRSNHPMDKIFGYCRIPVLVIERGNHPWNISLPLLCFQGITQFVDLEVTVRTNITTFFCHSVAIVIYLFTHYTIFIRIRISF